jgi:predicted acylesterase/phospholipase RssA
MVNVALATAAAPTYFRPLEHSGYTLLDGGVWANNPIMLAVIEALICFDITREQVDVLSLGCGDDRYVVSQMLGNDPPVLSDHDAVGIGVNLDGTPYRAGRHRVFVVIEAHQAGLRDRCRHRIEAIEPPGIGN